MARGALTALLSLLLLGVAASGAANVVSVGVNNFEETVVNSYNVWVLEYFSARCGTCQELAPLYSGLAEKYASVLSFGGVDIDTDEGMELAQQQGVLETDGVPTIRIFASLNTKESYLLFSGWEVPTFEALDEALMRIITESQAGRADAKEGRHYMKV